MPSDQAQYGPPGTIVQSPELNKEGKPQQRSIRDAGMAKNIVQLIIQASRNRSIVGARIMAKYNAERPYDTARLEMEGLGWRNNFTTKPLPQMIEKVAPRFYEAVNNLKYFTNASLSNKWENSVEKSNKFREIITNTIRRRKEWPSTIEDIAFTNALFGYAIVAWLDKYTWFPQTFLFDQAFLPDGTKQDTKFCQVAVVKEIFLPHELYQKIEDREVAEAAGWNIAATIKQINKASPDQVRDNLTSGGTLEFWYQNAQRELALGASYMSGASVIVVYSLLAREVNGKISHFRLAGNELEEIFSRDDHFDDAEDCLCFYSFQKGNSTMQGSKGIGRDIYELAGMIDRSRNESVDRLFMSGKTLFQGDPRRVHTFKMHVVGMAALVPANWQLLEQKLDGNVEPFLKMDAYFQTIVDQLIGNTSPPQLLAQEGGEGLRSPVAWNLIAAREEETKDVRIARFLRQFTNMVQTMTKRICDPETTEEDAKAAQEELLTHMTREEITELSEQPVAETVIDLTPMQRQMVASVVMEKKGNPLYNQRQLEIEDLTARIDSDFANRVLLPANDPTEQAEQLRLQQMELALLQQGQAVPVSPRDNHVLHLQVLIPVAEQVSAEILQGNSNTQVLEAIAAHVTEHYNLAQSMGVPKEAIQPAADFVKKIGATLAQLKELDAQASQLSAQSADLDAQDAQSLPL